MQSQNSSTAIAFGHATSISGVSLSKEASRDTTMMRNTSEPINAGLAKDVGQQRKEDSFHRSLNNMMNRLERDAKNVVKFFAAVRTQVAVQCTWLKGTEIDDVALKLATADISKHGAHCPEEDSLAASRSSREWKREGSSLA